MTGGRPFAPATRRSAARGGAPEPGGARRRALLQAAPALAALGMTTACTVLENTAPRFDFFVIEDLHTPAPSPDGTTRAKLTLLLAIGPSQSLYESDRIVYTRDGPSRSYYQYSNWSERPVRRIVSLAEARLAAGGRFRAVAQTVSGVRGDLVLTVRLDELIHDDSVSPGQLRVGIAAELVAWRSRSLAGRQTFRQTAPVASRDARGAARAASVAVTAALDALTAWTESFADSPA